MGEAVYQADYLFLGNGEVILNGMLRCDAEGRTLDLGEKLDHEGLPIKKLKGGLCPGFINTHCHLELSHLHQKVPQHQGLHEFIPALQSQRQIEEEKILEAIRDWDQAMQKAGIKAVGDITNGMHTLKTKQLSPIHYYSFIELFGLRKQKAEEIFKHGLELQETFESAGMSCSLSPHAPYSLSDDLFKLIADQVKNKVISIHNQESEGELLMFSKQDGPLRQMLENFGNQKEELHRSSENSLLHALSFFPEGQRVLLVHNTFTEKSDLQAAVESKKDLYWCFCPQANWYIEKRLPNIPLFSEMGLKCTLGTDSLASNHQLSILEEMKLIKAHYPEIKTKELMKWACENGAELLSLSQLGSMEVGKKCGLNHLSGLDESGEIDEKTTLKPII